MSRPPRHALHALVPPRVMVLTFAAELDEGTDLNAALCGHATERVWPLDVPVERLVAMTRLTPELEPVREMFRQMEDLRAGGVPAEFAARGGAGLVGIAVSATIAPARAAAEPWSGPSGREAFAWLDPPFPRWLLSYGLPARIARDEALWSAWTRLTDALRHADERQLWLGLHVS